MARLNTLKWKRSSAGALLEVSGNKQSKLLREEPSVKWFAFAAALLPALVASPRLEREARRAVSAEVLSTSRVVAPERSSSQSPTLAMPSSTDAVYDGYGRETTDAFHATLLWEKIVLHLERTVRCAKRSQGLRYYENCFHGSKSVDVLMEYLNAILPAKAVKRAQIRTLFQQLLNTGVIEDVRSKDKYVFRENRLYRFTGNHFWEPTEMEHIPRSRSVEHFSHRDEITAAPKLPSSCKLQLQKGYTSDSTVTASSHKHRERQRAALKGPVHRSLSTRERFTSVFQCTRPNPEPTKLKLKAPPALSTKPSRKESSSRGAGGFIKRKVSFLVQKDFHRSQQETLQATPIVQQAPSHPKSHFECALKDRKNLQSNPRHNHHEKKTCTLHSPQNEREHRTLTPYPHRKEKTSTPHCHREQRRHKERSRRHESKMTAAQRHDSSRRLCHQHSKHSMGSLSDETDSSGKWVVYGYV